VPPRASDAAQKIVPTHVFKPAPPPDVLIISGGQGIRYTGIESAIEFTRERFPELQYLITVCTGGVLAGRAAVLER
jgi:putative intracellular protease/amidase